MTLYYWLDPQNYADKYTTIYDHKRSPPCVLFMRGNPVTKEEVASTPPIAYSYPNFVPPENTPKDFSKLFLHFEAPRAKLQDWDCLINTSTAPVVNKRVADLLEKLAPNDVQFFPVQVICEDGISLDYFLVNITHKIFGLDREKSLYTLHNSPNWPADAISGYKHPIYKPGCMGEHLIARDADYRGHILVTQALVDTFKRSKPQISGVRFELPEDYYRLLYGDNFDRLNLFE